MTEYLLKSDMREPESEVKQKGAVNHEIFGFSFISNCQGLIFERPYDRTIMLFFNHVFFSYC